MSGVGSETEEEKVRCRAFFVGGASEEEEVRSYYGEGVSTSC